MHGKHKPFNCSSRNCFAGDKYKGIILGHEICGEVLELGKEVPSQCHVRPGDTVIVYPWRGCQNCEACREGESQLCENNEGGSTEIGQGAFGGGYGSYVVVPEWELAIRLPKNVDPVIGCLLPCSGLTAYSAILKTRPALDLAVRIRGFANLLVIGAGGLGLWVITLVKSVFCDQNVRIICADSREEKLKVANRMGADDALLWKKDTTVDELVDLTTMSGYNKLDAAIDFVGTPRTTMAAFKSMHTGGAIVAIGFGGGELPVSIPTLISKSISLHGVRVASLHTLKDLVELISVQNPERYPPTEIITLKEVNDMLDRMRKGTLKGRSIIKYVHKEA